MKKLMTLTATVLVIWVVSGAVLARDGAPRPERGARQGRSGAASVEKLLESLNLNETDLARAKQIFDTQRQAAANWKKENAEDFKDIRDAMAKAKKAGDTAALKAAGDRMRKLMASRRGGFDEVFVQLSEILSKEQLAKVKGLLSPQKPVGNSYLLRPEVFNAALAKLDLTDAQKAEIKKIRTALNAETEKIRAAMKDAKTREDKSEIMKGFGQIAKDAWDKIKAVLGAELTAKLQQVAGQTARDAQRRKDPFAGLELTDGQKDKIAAIRKSVRDKMQNARSGEARRAVITDMRKEIDDVLSDEQKAQLKEQMAKRRKAYEQSKGRRDKTVK